MSLLSKKGEKGDVKTIAILDVGSGSVGAALARLDRNGHPAILSNTRVTFPLRPSRDMGALSKEVIKASREALERLSKPEKPAQAAVFLPAPWSSLLLRTMRLAREKPFRVTPATVSRMVSECISREKQAENGTTVIERSAVGIHLNGYSVDVLPKEASVLSAELTVVSVTAERALVASLREEVARAFTHIVPVTFHSTPLSCAYALSSIFPDPGEYLVCDGEGEISECLLVLEHSPAGSATAPTGCNALLRTLSSHADMARAEASSALHLARSGTSPMSKKLQGTLSAVKRECADGFRAAASELLKNAPLVPRTVYVLGHGSEGQWFADAIAGASFMKTLLPGGTTVKALLPADISSGLVLSGRGEKSSRTADVYLSLEAIFADARFDHHLALNFKLGT